MLDSGKWIAWRSGGVNQAYVEARSEVDAVRALADQERESFAVVLQTLDDKLKTEPSWHVADSLSLVRATLRDMDTVFPKVTQR
jgi:hypothetical protein